MPVIVLENWTASKLENGTFSLSCTQSDSNYAEPFAIRNPNNENKKNKSKKNKYEQKNKKTKCEHKFIVNKVTKSNNIFGWCAELYHKPTRTRYTLVLGIKNQMRVPQKEPEPEPHTTEDATEDATEDTTDNIVEDTTENMVEDMVDDMTDEMTEETADESDTENKNGDENNSSDSENEKKRPTVPAQSLEELDNMFGTVTEVPVAKIYKNNIMVEPLPE